MKYQIIQGDNRVALKQYANNYFDSIITDPPYGIDFLGKSWDANTGALETYQECLRVLKPGGHILAFSAARTYHHLAITLEQAGFEIRDQIMWIYSSGFPKSQDVGKNNDLPEWEGWGTALKPAHEPICLARKPIKTSIAKNVERYGTGALNINATRIESEPRTYPANGINRMTFNQAQPDKWQGDVVTNEQGRFPSNVLGEIPDYQKYFYCPKVSRRERHIGFEDPGPQTARERDENGNVLNRPAKKAGASANVLVEQFQLSDKGNNHPTVKPVELMKYLIKLVTPKGGRVLDPFNGSGTTGMAAVELGYEYVGIELDPNYVDISQRRIESWYKHSNPLLASGLLKYVESRTA